MCAGTIRGSVSEVFTLDALPHSASKGVGLKISFDEEMAPPTFCFQRIFRRAFVICLRHQVCPSAIAPGVVPVYILPVKRKTVGLFAHVINEVLKRI
jgi:hypothetical protein